MLDDLLGPPVQYELPLAIISSRLMFTLVPEVFPCDENSRKISGTRVTDVLNRTKKHLQKHFS